MISLVTKVIIFVCPFLWAMSMSSVNGFATHQQTSYINNINMRTINNNCIRLHAAKDADMTDEEREVAMEKALKAMTAFSNKYAENTNTYYCEDKSIPAVVIKGLAEHKVKLGKPLCPCRFYEDKEAEAKEGYWNCPCVPMRERHECHCMLFLTEDNDFAGTERNISFEEVKDKCGGF